MNTPTKISACSLMLALSAFGGGCVDVGSMDDLEEIELSETSQALTSYCQIDRPGASAEEWIRLISLGDINSVSGVSPTGYSDFTSQSTQLIMGASASMDVGAAFSAIERTEHWKAWLDVNEDGVFNDAAFGTAGSERLFPTFDTTDSATGTIHFTVPAAASPGLKRMRILMTRLPAARKSWQSPCNLSNGEIEDYTIDLAGG